MKGTVGLLYTAHQAIVGIEVLTCSFSTNVAPGRLLSQASCSPLIMAGWWPVKAAKADTGIGLATSSLPSDVTVCLLPCVVAP